MSSPKTPARPARAPGPHGGLRFVPETLMAPLEELTEAYLFAEGRTERFSRN